MKRVGLFGLTFFSGNKGCSALAYSFLEILNRVSKEKNIEVVVFTEGVVDNIENSNKNIFIELIEYRIKSLSSMMNLKREIRKCDYVFDFTEGDSFSDIYGIKRMLRVSLTKLIVLATKVPLILGPQTYGPYKSLIAKKMAKYIVNKSNYACSRDQISATNMELLTGNHMDSFTDIAFVLPKAKENYELQSKPKFGINVSALLWNGGYNNKNQFGLSLDYKEYILRLIDKLQNNFEYEIHLIPHVISEKYESVENDYRICKELAEQYTDVIAAPAFTTPMQAKKYISEMDVFVGARMHATIGAFSSGVVTIPFSYSVKFEGLFESVDYQYIIHGKTMDLEEALTTTIKYIEKCEELSEKQQYSMKIVNKKLNDFYKKMEMILSAKE